ncbi:ATP-binding protein [Candidatus Venteria ishoeyi]|uniref:histidine kinase n=1 Tax=Candidatus Venteria ishoeyi TaxID=1899563 RepID=A0A1H6F4M2_9GAMM|nr:ATP-binding protein [Candidatus Venteria ishoeyi]SEH04331.1 C4-dicarboxylate transport sensor protein DctB [Candidatus Venteria ishoeyi]
MSDNKNPIPLEKRLITGEITSISPSVIHLSLPVDFPYAKHARLAKDNFPPNRDYHDFHLHEKVPLFILQATHQDRDLFHATAKWAERNTNPWFTEEIVKGKTVRGTATDYVEDFGVIISLDNGVEGFLHISAIPGSTWGKKITDLIHIGDNILALIEDINRDTLEIKLNIKKLVEKKKQEEQWFYEHEPFPGEEGFSDEPATSELPKAIVPANTHILLIDNDPFFSDALADWLRILGCEVTTSTNCEGIKTHLKQNKITHILLDYRLDTPQQSRCIRELCKKETIPVVFISGDKEVEVCHEAKKYHWDYLPKPVNMEILQDWLCKGYLPEPAIKPKKQNMRQKNQSLWQASYQERVITQEGSELLAEICQQTACCAALWVKRERIGVFSIRAYHGMEKSVLEDTQIFFANTWLNDAIESGEDITSMVDRSGVLCRIAPQDSQYIWVFSLTFDGITDRALAFFRKTPFDGACKEQIKQYRPRMVDLIRLLILTQHLAESETFASLGRVNSGLLHEIKGATAPLLPLLDTMKHTLGDEPETMACREQLYRLSRYIKKIHQLAHTNLELIQKEQREKISINTLIQRIVHLFQTTHNDSIRWELVPAPSNLTLTLPPAVIEQPLINLLDNAVYHLQGKENGKIIITVESHNETPETPLWVLIEDNGQGLTAEQRTQLFSPRITSKGQKGTGMGLYISRNILRSIDGELELKDTIRWFGSTFCMRLPMRLADMKTER